MSIFRIKEFSNANKSQELQNVHTLNKVKLSFCIYMYTGVDMSV